MAVNRVGGGTDPVGEVWATQTDEEGNLNLLPDGTTEEDGITSPKAYAQWLDLIENHENYTVSVRNKCDSSERILEYGESQDYMYFGGDTSGSVEYEKTEQRISVTGDVVEGCLPMQYIVTKK